MEIRISEKEITAGVVAYLNSRGMNLDADNVNIEYTAGRKPAGITAILLEGPRTVAEAVEPEPEQAKSEPKLTGQVAGSGPALEQAAEPAPDPAEPEPAVQADPAVQTGDDAAATQAGVSLFG